MYFESPISSKELARKLYLPVPLITAMKKEFIKVGIVEQYKGISITPKGEQYVEDQLGYKGLNKGLYQKLTKACRMKDVFNDEIKTIKNIFDARPSVDFTVDQAHCDYITSMRRAMLSLKYKTLINKKILCIGDDDLVSVSLGLLINKLYDNSQDNKTEIHVVDIDSRYLEYIDKIARDFNLPIICHNRDLRQKLHDELIEEFDCFYTDPPYTMNGMRLFLSRGVDALKRRKGLPIFLSFAHRSYDASYKILTKINQMGLSVDRIVPKFNSYEGASILGNIGQLMVLNTTSYTKSDIKGDNYTEYLYTKQCKKNRKEKVRC
ncbi:bis-aminopropyl spermidine synthase family protein [Clostridiaceae bacterium M8S5]|nr:bis-aminopropyl spermidine synthase family protein [Clostridiaceae bacterium M8S5]